MVRSATADEYLLTYLNSLAIKNTYAVGLILGQTFSGKDYIIHFAKTPPLEADEDSKQNQSIRELKNISEINENLISDHARQVSRMLPGGTHILGIFIISPEDLLSPFHTKLKTILQTMHKQLDTSKYLCGNAGTEKFVINYYSKTLRCSCKAYDVFSHNVQPANLNFVNKSAVWKSVECNLDVDYLQYLKNTESDWPLQKHIENVLFELLKSLQLATYFFDGEYKEPDESLENTEKKKIKGANQVKSIADTGKGSKPIRATIYQQDSLHSTKEIMETSGQLRLVGQIVSKVWLPPKVTIDEASQSVREDIMRSLAARLEMHWDSLTEEENSEGINCVHEPPRRVLIELPNSYITLSDYLFPGEGPEDAKTSLEELLDIENKAKLKLQDIEGQADISLYDSALESDSEESLPLKFSKDNNKLLYVGVIIGLIVLIIALLLQLRQ